MIEILIEVKGGVVTAVRSNHGDVNISLLDHDVLKERKGLSSDEISKIHAKLAQEYWLQIDDSEFKLIEK